MKNILLFLLVFVLSASVYAQYHFTGQWQPVKVENYEVTPDGLPAFDGHPLLTGKSILDANIGTTWYDLQSYVNIMSRLWAFDDGSVGAIWMAAGQNLSPNRGTGYNYYDGVQWDTPLMHLGDDERTGWPSYAKWGPNGEVIVHYWYPGGGEQGPIRIYTRENKGEGDWTMNTLWGPDGLSIVWHSMMTSGENNEYIHLLARTYDDPYLGQDNALLYYRSSDGGESWEIEAELIEGLGSDYRPNSANLEYMWAKPVGETIAFCYGFDEFGGQVFKSTDNGDNWDVIDAFVSPLDPFNLPSDSDVIPCGDGACAIALDSQGKAHVVFGKKLVIFQGGDEYWFPMSTDGVIYWNEDMPPLDTTIISSYTNQYLIDGGNLVGHLLPDETGSYEILPEQYFYGNECMTSFSQLGIDDQDNLFLVYSAIAPGYDNGASNYRHIHVNASFDGGNTWTGPFDINTDIVYWLSECAYPAIPVYIKDKIHVTFQMDDIPGINQWLTNHDPNENQIVHMEFEKDDFVGINNKEKENDFEVSGNYPNPATKNTKIRIMLSEPSYATLEVVSVDGKRVLYKDLGRLTKGMNEVSFYVGNLSPGLYYYSVSSQKGKVTKKFIVQ